MEASCRVRRGWLLGVLGASCLALCAPGVARATSASVYVANVGSHGAGGVSQYTVGGLGRLSPKRHATVAAGNGPVEIRATPNGKNLYVTNSIIGRGGISQYRVGAGGRLFPLTPATVAAGNGPTELAVSPNGKNVYVVKDHGNSPVVIARIPHPGDDRVGRSRAGHDPPAGAVAGRAGFRRLTGHRLAACVGTSFCV